MQDTIETRVVEAVARSQMVPAERVALDTTFEELGMSSLDALALIADLEEEFDVEIPNDDAMGLRTVRQAVACVARLKGAAFATSGDVAGGEA